jgi:hypothetical protein
MVPGTGSGFGRHDQPYQRHLNHCLGGVDLGYDISNTRRAQWEIMNGPEDEAFDPTRIPVLRHENSTDDIRDRGFNSRVNFELPLRTAGARGPLGGEPGGGERTPSWRRRVRNSLSVEGTEDMSSLPSNPEGSSTPSPSGSPSSKAAPAADRGGDPVPPSALLPTSGSA